MSSSAAPRERRHHDTGRVSAAALVLALATLAGPAANAQTAVPCTAIENDVERLACYDRALRGTPPAPPERAAPAAPARAAAPATAPAPSAAAPPTATTPATVATEARGERRVREATAPAAPAAPTISASSGKSGEAITPLVIVGVRALPSRHTLFTAEDRTSWVQTDSQRIMALPDTPFDAELKSGAMGSFFLVPKDGARAIRVRPAR